MTLIFIIIGISFSAEATGGNLSFLNISGSANVRALGNTMGSDIHNPSSLLMSPANIWQYSKFKYIGTIQEMEYDFGAKYQNSFLGFKKGRSTAAIGIINYKIDDIEEYDYNANYMGNFSYQDFALMLGFANRVSNFVWGLGANIIRQNFENLESWEEPNYFYGIDAGVSLLDIRYGEKEDNGDYNEKFSLSFGGAMKMMFKGAFNNQESANSTTSLFTKISIAPDILNSVNYKFILRSFNDLSFQQFLNRYNYNMGLQANVIFITDMLFNKKTKNSTNKLEKKKKDKTKKLPNIDLKLNFGISNILIPINNYRKMDADYIQSLKYNKKISWGFGIDIGKRFGFDCSFIINDQYFNGNYITAKLYL